MAIHYRVKLFPRKEEGKQIFGYTDQSREILDRHLQTRGNLGEKF